MTIKLKLGIAILLAIAVLIGCLVFQNNQQQSDISDSLSSSVSKITESADEEVEATLLNQADKISLYLVNLEQEVDSNMLNAALYLQNALNFNPKMTDRDIIAMTEKVGMTELLVSDEKGNFFLSTNPASKSVNLFDIWDGYRGLVTDPNLILPSNLKISAENHSIFKYMAIPRTDAPGCLEAALNSDRMKTAVSDFVSDVKGLSSLVLVDNTNLVLMNIGKGPETANYQEGEISDEAALQEGFTSGQRKIVDGEGTKTLYCPIDRGNGIAYVMKLTVNTAPYYETAEMLSGDITALSAGLTKRMNIGTIVISVLMFVTAAIVLLIVGQTLKPVSKMAKAAQKVSRGNLEVHVYGKYSGEVGVLVRAFNSMTDDLRTMLKNVKSTSTTIKGSSGNIRESLEVVTDSSIQVAHATSEISQGTYDLAQNNTQVYKNTNDLSSNLETMIANIEEVNQNILKMEGYNNDGVGSLGNLNENFKHSIESVNDVEAKITELQEKSKHISEIVGTIKTIASQTNLLALNATIEAARAGEHGKGFAVVAGEVRRLAESSNHETEEIAAIITDIINMVDSTTESMDFTRQSITETSEALTSTMQLFSSLSDTTDEVARRSQIMEQSVKSISQAKDDLMGLVTSISAISEQSAASSKEVSQSTSRQTKELEDVRNQIVKMDEIVGQLNELIGKYSV